MRGAKKKGKKSCSFRFFRICILVFAVSLMGFQIYILSKPAPLNLAHVTSVTHEEKDTGSPPKKLRSVNQIFEEKNADDIQRLITFAQGGQPPDDEALKDLPSSSDFKALYGNEIVIKGLETCEAYRNSVKEGLRHIGPAGIFNTGTNYLSNLLRKNCMVKNIHFRKGVRFQVPWGKHSPASFRLINIAKVDGEGVDQENVLPVVTIKDPYTWMTSMCRHSYTAYWKHSEDHCPNLIPNKKDRLHFPPSDLPEEGPIPLTVRYGPGKIWTYESLLHLWNKYYRDYFEVTNYPRLIVRYEDFLTHPVEITTKICECAGGVMQHPKKFDIQTESAKGNWGVHKGSQGLVSALKKYGNAEIRKSAFPDRNDVDFAKLNLDEILMGEFNYDFIH